MIIETHWKQNNLQYNWQTVFSALNQFLISDDKFLLICVDEGSHKSLSKVDLNKINDVDFVQFLSLPLRKRGEMGVREIRWVLTSKLSSASLLITLSKMPISQKIPLIKFFRYRISRVRRRESVLKSLLGEQFLRFTHIAHAIEPAASPIIISRAFARAVLSLNQNGYLNFERTCFALARSSNFICIRVTGL